MIRVSADPRTFARIRRITFIILGISVAVATLVLAFSRVSPASAAPTPASCFTFDTASRTITDYNAADPACPKDVEIPAVLGDPAVPVETIGGSAFMMKGITSVVIPESIVSIREMAFMHNQLSSLRIPSSVTSIGLYAFAVNQFTAVMIDGDPTVGQDAFGIQGASGYGADCMAAGSCSWDFANVVALAIYAPNMTTPLENQLMWEHDFGGEANHDGINSLAHVQLINPTPLTIRYLDAAGNQLRPNTTLFGDGIADQRVGTLQAAHPGATSADIANIYYFAGANTTQTPPAISGYTTPAAQSHTFASGTNTLTFTYASAANNNEQNQNSTDDINSPDSGIGSTAPIITIATIATVIILIATSTILTARRNHR